MILYGLQADKKRIRDLLVRQPVADFPHDFLFTRRDVVLCAQQIKRDLFFLNGMQYRQIGLVLDIYWYKGTSDEKQENKSESYINIILVTL